MALSVDYLYQFSLKLIRKNQAGGLSNVEFQYHWNDAQATYMDDLLGRFQARNNGKEGANTGLIQNETILTKLSPFTRTDTITIVSGFGPIPTGLLYKLALRINDAQVVYVDKDEIWSMLDDVIDPPSIADNSYYYTEYNGQYKFYPSAVTEAVIDYIIVPTDVVWGFTLDVNSRQVYNVGTSTQPIWDDNSCREITKRMLTNIGVSFKDQDFANFGSKVQIAGE